MPQLGALLKCDWCLSFTLRKICSTQTLSHHETFERICEWCDRGGECDGMGIFILRAEVYAEKNVNKKAVGGEIFPVISGEGCINVLAKMLRRCWKNNSQVLDHSPGL